MFTDSFFEQGATHLVCEDYALHREGYAVVSDGCSNRNGPPLNTDWGSRLLCKAAACWLDRIRRRSVLNMEAGEFFEQVADEAMGYVEGIYDVDVSCLTATLGIAHADPDEVRLLLMGDGVVGGRRRDGSWKVTVYAAENAAPFYASYLLSKVDRDAYFQRLGGRHTATTYCCGPHFEAVCDSWETDATLTPESPWFCQRLSRDEYDLAFVGTDGLCSFFAKVQAATSKHTEPVAVTDTLGVIFDVPRTDPAYFRRQRHWAFKREFPRRNWHNADDVSLGVVCLAD